MSVGVGVGMSEWMGVCVVVGVGVGEWMVLVWVWVWVDVGGWVCKDLLIEDLHGYLASPACGSDAARGLADHMWHCSVSKVAPWHISTYLWYISAFSIYLTIYLSPHICLDNMPVYLSVYLCALALTICHVII